MFPSKLALRRLALAGIVGPIVWWLLIIVNGAITPGYSHVSDFISTLGGVGAPYAIGQQFNFAVLSGSILALAIGIHYWFGDGRRPRVGTVLLGILGVCVLLAGAFPENAAVPDSMTNVLHTASSMVGFIAGIGGISLVSRRVVADDRWPTVHYEVAGTVGIVLVTFVVSTFAVIIESAFLGITQRLLIGVMTLWLVMQSVRLYRLVDTPERSETGERRTDPTEAKTAD